MVNINGIPCINSTGVAVSTANVTYSFDNSREIPFAGLVLVRLQQAVPTGTTATLPVLFEIGRASCRERVFRAV